MHLNIWFIIAIVHYIYINANTEQEKMISKYRINIIFSIPFCLQIKGYEYHAEYERLTKKERLSYVCIYKQYVIRNVAMERGGD